MYGRDNPEYYWSEWLRKEYVTPVTSEGVQPCRCASTRGQVGSKTSALISAGSRRMSPCQGPRPRDQIRSGADLSMHYGFSPNTTYCPPKGSQRKAFSRGRAQHHFGGKNIRFSIPTLRMPASASPVRASRLGSRIACRSNRRPGDDPSRYRIVRIVFKYIAAATGLEHTRHLCVRTPAAHLALYDEKRRWRGPRQK